MSEMELLKEYLEQEMNNVFCYSANYLMDTPKRGYEKEFEEAQERVKLLKGLVEKLAKGVE